MSIFFQLQEPQSGGGSFQGSGTTSQQSRLNQWKLPSLDKDGSGCGGGGVISGGDNTDFSRAPGTTAKSTMSISNSAMGSLGGLQGDG